MTLYIRIAITVLALFFIANTTAQEEVFQENIIANPTFEFGWIDWVDVDPNGGATSISGFGQTDEKSAKIVGDTGHFEQEIEIFPDSDYVLRAVIRGPGIVTVMVEGSELTASSEGDGDNWIPVEIEFSAGSATSAIIGGRYLKDEDARFDDYELYGLSGPALEYVYVPEVEPERIFTTLPGACTAMSQLRIVSATDDGSNDGHTPEMTIDGNFIPESRWSSELEGKELLLDLGEPQILKEVGIAFYKGNERTSTFAIEASVSGGRYNDVRGDSLTSSGESTAIERFDFNDRKARFIKIIGFGNSSNDWNSFIEVQAFGCGSGQIASTGDGSDTALLANISSYGFKTNVAPAENFDLTNWKITLPIDDDEDGRADEIKEAAMASGWTDDRFFYTDPVTGGMVFRVAGTGATTPNSSFVRTELREMLRGGDESIPTRNSGELTSANNWVFSAAPAEARAAAGGVDGVMRATLAVNQVTRMGDGSRIGRVIIGQIHARDGEPIRLYYRKLPTNKYGSVYYIHEREGVSDIHVPLIGDRSDFAENPEDGIALDEVFSYEIMTTGEEIDGVIHPMLHVKIIRDDGTEVVAPPLDMIDSNYATATEFMYFKAGAYSQNVSPWPERDFDQVTFFDLEVEH